MERLNSIFDRYGGHYSFVIGLLLPFGMVANNIAMVMVVLGGLAAKKTSQQVHLPYAKYFLAALLMFFAISCTGIIHAGDSVGPILSGTKGYALWLLPLVAIPWFQDRQRRLRFLAGATIGFAVAIVYTWIQNIDFYSNWMLLPSWPKPSNYRAGFFDNALTWSGVLTIAAIGILGLPFTIRNTTESRAHLTAQVAVFTTASLLQRTYIFVLMILLPSILLRNWRKKIVAYTLIFASAAALATGIGLLPDQFAKNSSVIQTIQARLSWQGLLHSDSVETRKTLWKAAAKAVSEQPLTGLGVGGFRPYLAQQVSDAKPYRHAHNSYLTIAAETGLPGIAVFMCAMIILLLSAAKIDTRNIPVLLVCILAAITESTLQDSEIIIATSLWLSISIAAYTEYSIVATERTP